MNTFGAYETIRIAGIYMNLEVETSALGEVLEVVASRVSVPNAKATFAPEGFTTQFIGYAEWSDFVATVFDEVGFDEVVEFITDSLAGGEVTDGTAQPLPTI